MLEAQCNPAPPSCASCLPHIPSAALHPPPSQPASPTCTALLLEADELAQAWLSGSEFSADQQ